MVQLFAMLTLDIYYNALFFAEIRLKTTDSIISADKSNFIKFFKK